MGSEGAILRIGRKGTIVIPKRIREALSLKKGSYVTVELREGFIAIKPFAVKRVRLGGKISAIVAESKNEEARLEAR